jgi:hypothetical protein
MCVINLNEERRLRRGSVLPRNSRRPVGRAGELRGTLPMTVGEIANQILERLNKGR